MPVLSAGFPAAVMTQALPVSVTQGGLLPLALCQALGADKPAEMGGAALCRLPGRRPSIFRSAAAVSDPVSQLLGQLRSLVQGLRPPQLWL